MYARLLALFGLLYVSASMGRSQSTFLPGSEVEVYLKGDTGSRVDVLGEMNRELAALMQPAGFRIVWRHGNDKPSPGGAAYLIMVELRGRCERPSVHGSSVPLPPSLALASSSMADGRVLPFTWVDCSALNHFLGRAIFSHSESEQTYIYGRSMARLLAHEFYHVLAQTNDHTQTGISKARFSTADLLAEHFDFEAAALEKLRPPALGLSAGGESVAGR